MTESIVSQVPSSDQQSADIAGIERALPLKKRRRVDSASDTEDGRSSFVGVVTPNKPRANLPVIGSSSPGGKLAALALVAASAPRINTAPGSPQLIQVQAPQHQGRNETEKVTVHRVPHGFSMHTERPVSLPPPPVSPLRPTFSRQRAHHPPLSQPLPNGCHGRTSRNNSYCRRQPCYNGSKYCKLHYHQYVVACTRLPQEGNKATNGVLVNVHQNRRFTGCDGDTRCQATTTRGRACAYVAVNGTKYCYLHVDYDTNPPPKRGTSNAASQRCLVIPNIQVATSLGLCTKDMSKSTGSPTLSGIMAGTDSSSIVTVVSQSSEDSCSAPPSPDRERSLSRDLGMASLNLPLLSSVSSDQWFHKKVMIATGPLVNRTGVVEKWGNGWVSVRVRDGLLHNRRSVELLVLPDQDSPVISD